MRFFLSKAFDEGVDGVVHVFSLSLQHEIRHGVSKLRRNASPYRNVNNSKAVAYFSFSIS